MYVCDWHIIINNYYNNYYKNKEINIPQTLLLYEIRTTLEVEGKIMFTLSPLRDNINNV